MTLLEEGSSNVNDESWYSATLRFYSVTREMGRVGGEDVVHLIRAPSYGDAVRKFLALGRSREHSYVNGCGHMLRVRFVGLVTVDSIADDDLDGAEIVSIPLMEEDPSFSFDTPLDPDNYKFTETH